MKIGTHFYGQVFEATLEAHREIELLPQGRDDPKAEAIYRKHGLTHLADGLARRRMKTEARSVENREKTVAV